MNKTLVILAFVVIILAVLISLFISEVGTDYAVLGMNPFRGQTECNDGIENDGDGFVDLIDPGCSSKDDDSESDPTKECDDGLDNDYDGYLDMEDDDCVSPIDVDESN